MKTKKLKLKRWVCFVLGIIFTLVTQQTIKFISETYDNWYKECDNHYGYTVDYYTCRQYHIHK